MARLPAHAHVHPRPTVSTANTPAGFGSAPAFHVTKTGVVLDGEPDADYVAASLHGTFEGLTFDGLCFDPESLERRIAQARADG